MQKKVEIIPTDKVYPLDIPGKDVGFWKVWGSTEGLFMTQSAYNAIKKHFQQIKFRPGDTIQNCKDPGRLLIVVDHNHTDYFCTDSFGKNVNFPFHEAQKLTESVKKAAEPIKPAPEDSRAVTRTVYPCKYCGREQKEPFKYCPHCSLSSE